MQLLNRYIAKTIVPAIGLVFLILTALYLFTGLIDELGDIGKGNYDIWGAVYYVLLRLPEKLYSLFPIASLIGGLIGLGLLASRSELIVMRAAGVSIAQITWMVIKTALVVIIIVSLLAELFVPTTTHLAESYKAIAKSQGQALRTKRGVWLRQPDAFVHIHQVLPDGKLNGIARYQLNDKQKLETASFAKQASKVKHAWLLQDVVETHLSSQQITTKEYKNLKWDNPYSADLLSIVSIHPAEMSLLQLFNYVNELNLHGLSAKNYKLAYWQRLLQPFASLVMLLLAVPFIFGPLRSVSMGLRMLAGITVGFVFYIMNQFFGPLSIVYQFPPVLAAASPIVLFALLGYYLMRRTH
ncbi:MAG: LPS export ABC transporter permease LptG [Gammaproteobacteria bacterium]